MTDTEEEIARLKKRLARERAARVEAERIGEESTRKLYDTLQASQQTNAELQRIKKTLHEEILALSTPVVQIWDRIVALPLVGTLDSDRAQRMTESLLEEIVAREAEVVIVDISGVPVMDTLVAQHLISTVRAARLMGAKTILSGLRPETAQTIVHLGIDWSSIDARATVRDALRLAFRLLEPGLAR